MALVFKKIPFVDDVLHGISQIMLQENRWTGLLFLIGMFIGDWHYAAAALLATTVGTTVALLLKFDRTLIQKGVYGFNSALVGVTLAYFFDSTPLIWILIIIIGGGLTVLLSHYFIHIKKTVFTFPYILVAWALFVILYRLTNTVHSDIVQASFGSTTSRYGDYLSAIGGFGQVIFQQNIVASFIFFLGVYISKPIAALYGLIASLMGALLSQVVGESTDIVYMGLFGFNAVLTALVFSGTDREDGFWVLVGTVITIFINILLVHYQILDYVGGVFTFPFVLGTWATLWLKKRYAKIKPKIEFY